MPLHIEEWNRIIELGRVPALTPETKAVEIPARNR